MTTALHPSRPAASLLDPALLRGALRDAFIKLNPAAQWRNPVMFVVWLCAVLISALWLQALAGQPQAFAELREATAVLATSEAAAQVRVQYGRITNVQTTTVNNSTQQTVGTVVGGGIGVIAVVVAITRVCEGQGQRRA